MFVSDWFGKGVAHDDGNNRTTLTGMIIFVGSFSSSV